MMMRAWNATSTWFREPDAVYADTVLEIVWSMAGS